MESTAPFIAVVDDEAAVRRALLRLLRSAHYQAEAFESAALFLESLSERTPQCLILDLHMPAMTGLELQECLLHLQVRVPIIVITAFDGVDTRERCLALNAKHYFCKPVEGDDLLEAVRLAVDNGARVGIDM
jgi:FixJ family two-component response regulator